MASPIKTLVATGASSGIGLELIRQLVAQNTPWSITLGARSVPSVTSALDASEPADPQTSVSVLPLDLKSLRNVKTFAQQALERLAGRRLDYLMLGAAVIAKESGDGPDGLPWNESYLVNHLSQHYLVHLLREKLVESKTRIVFVSSGAVRNVDDVSVIDDGIKPNSSSNSFQLYGQTKFVQLLGAHWWRRRLMGRCLVVAVSPGLVIGTRLTRDIDAEFSMSMPDAKTVPEGAQSVYAAFTRDDIPEDPEQIFLTSWGEWWSKDVYGRSLDKVLQDKFCPGREEIEKVAGIGEADP